MSNLRAEPSVSTSLPRPIGNSGVAAVEVGLNGKNKNHRSPLQARGILSSHIAHSCRLVRAFKSTRSFQPVLFYINLLQSFFQT